MKKDLAAKDLFVFNIYPRNWKGKCLIVANESRHRLDLFSF